MCQSALGKCLKLMGRNMKLSKFWCICTPVFDFYFNSFVWISFALWIKAWGAPLAISDHDEDIYLLSTTAIKWNSASQFLEFAIAQLVDDFSNLSHSLNQKTEHTTWALKIRQCQHVFLLTFFDRRKAFHITVVQNKSSGKCCEFKKHLDQF